MKQAIINKIAKTTIMNWEKWTSRVTTVFIEKYFDGEADYFWIGDDVGGVLSVNDYFFGLDRIIEALRYKASKKDFFAYYDIELDATMKGEKVGINFRNFLRGGKK